MSIHEEPYCHHGRTDCDCLDTSLAEAIGSVTQAGGLTVFASNNSGSAFGGTYSGRTFVFGPGNTYGSGGTGVIPTTTATSPTTSTTFDFIQPLPCLTHEVSDDSIELRGDEIWGSCLTCAVAIKIPRVSGGLNFEKAGIYVGRAMTLDGEDDESRCELFTELSILEEHTHKEIARYKRTLKMIQVARTIAKKLTLSRATELIE